MNSHNKIAIAASLCLSALFGNGAALAQTTDGYHSIQVFPVVVDTASFSQRFSFRNPNATAVSITPQYFPAVQIVAQPTAVTCNTLTIPAGKTVVQTSLRAMCPAMVAGSQFGYVYVSEASGKLPFAGFSRVANPQGNGFAVEAFPAHTFTSADSVVNGIRRLAATPSTPAFQTNCFLGNLNDVTPAATPVSTPVHFTVYDSASNVLGSGDTTLVPGKMTRLLDIFFAAGLGTAGDYNDAQVKFEEFSPTEEPALLAFCTVQDNTSFGADFRVAKQELGAGGLGFPGDVIGSQDNHVNRETRVAADGLGRTFEINSGDNSNTHVLYFRHPDYVSCELVNTGAGPFARLSAASGLEMRMLDQDGQVVAGGNGATGFDSVYLGDKTDRNGGANTRYTVEVEDGEQNSGVVRGYQLHCQSGSGHTLGDLLRYKEAADRF